MKKTSVHLRGTLAPYSTLVVFFGGRNLFMLSSPLFVEIIVFDYPASS